MGVSRRKGLASASQHERKEAESLKQEAGVQSIVKREYTAGESSPDDADDVLVVETRSCKRLRGERDVIVLD
jgi:hypothetical protein